MRKKIPSFKSEEKEKDFWKAHDTADYIDWKKGKQIIFPELQPSLKTISLRLPAMMIEQLKLLAHKKDVPYQSLLKIFLAEKIREELKGI